MGMESTIIQNGQTADDVNLIYINRALVPEANSSFRFIQLLFNFTDGPQIILRRPSFSNIISIY